MICNHFLVWVVTNNPSKKFLLKNYNPEKIDTKIFRALQVEETAYCWRDINNIIYVNFMFERGIPIKVYLFCLTILD